MDGVESIVCAGKVVKNSKDVVHVIALDDIPVHSDGNGSVFSCQYQTALLIQRALVALSL